jgi:hypothetical protein
LEIFQKGERDEFFGFEGSNEEVCVANFEADSGSSGGAGGSGYFGISWLELEHRSVQIIERVVALVRVQSLFLNWAL